MHSTEYLEKSWTNEINSWSPFLNSEKISKYLNGQILKEKMKQKNSDAAMQSVLLPKGQESQKPDFLRDP